MLKSNNCFAIYHPNYKNIIKITELINKQISNFTKNFICTANYLYLLRSSNNFLSVFLIIYNNNAYATKPGIIIKKKNRQKFFYIFFFPLLKLRLFFFSLILATFLSIIDYLSIKLICKKAIKIAKNLKYFILI